ncbi:MAG: hypothetical protein HY927_07970 [Elusimicrobia bacterium]|nr:hypothetical protein [Elusimicrobiota bacterium]
MRYLVTIGVAGSFCLMALGGFWRLHGLSQRELGVLTSQVDAMSSGWESKKVPAGNRVVNFVISDAESGPDPFVLPEEPGPLAQAMAWFKRSFVGGSPAAAEPAALAKSLADAPGAIAWTHEGFSVASEEAMTREIAKAIVKAHDAGAEINIVAQGVSASPALKALKSLEGAVRGGQKVGANKVVLVGMNPARLKRIAPVFFMDFKKPGNVLELANIWVPREDFVNKTPVVQLFSRSQNGTEFPAQDLWPMLAGQESAIMNLILIVRELIAKVSAMEAVVAPLAQAAAARAEEAQKRAVTMKSHDGHYFQREAATPAPSPPAAAPAAPPQDSLSMIKGGQEYSEAAAEAAKAAQAAKPAANRPGKQEASGDGIARWKEGEKKCASCCADVGGSWRNASYAGGKYGTVEERQDFWGCCRGADWPSNYGSIPSCAAGGSAYPSDGGCSMDRFRCARQ